MIFLLKSIEILIVDQLGLLWYNKLNLKERSLSMLVNISEAKTNLSKLIEMVYHGERVTIAKNNLPIADLVIHKPQGKRKLGLVKGKVHYKDDIMTEDEMLNSMFYGE